jgi:hypothetical protein
MAYLPDVLERLRRETEGGLRERLAASEKRAAALYDALGEEIRDRFDNMIWTDEELAHYIKHQHGIDPVS